MKVQAGLDDRATAHSVDVSMDTVHEYILERALAAGLKSREEVKKTPVAEIEKLLLPRGRMGIGEGSGKRLQACRI